MGTYKIMMGTYKFMMGTYKFMMGTYKELVLITDLSLKIFLIGSTIDELP
jgi:hypothetical protein